MPGRAFGSWYWYQIARRRENLVKTVARRTFWYPYTVWPLKFKKGKVTGWAVKASSQQLCHASDRRQRPGVDITLYRGPACQTGLLPLYPPLELHLCHPLSLFARPTWLPSPAFPPPLPPLLGRGAGNFDAGLPPVGQAKKDRLAWAWGGG